MEKFQISEAEMVALSTNGSLELIVSRTLEVLKRIRGIKVHSFKSFGGGIIYEVQLTKGETNNE